MKYLWDNFKKETDHPLSDFEAFDRWMSQVEGTYHERFVDVWGTLDLLEQISLYGIITDIMSFQAEQKEMEVK